jgi:CRP-like cAMP-binding protein
MPCPARRARVPSRSTVAPGTEIIREGDVGDRFYILAQGHVAVRQGDRDMGELGGGDSFGEIALLRDVPRTATVTARDDVELYALDRSHFLEAVGGHAAGRAAAEAVAAERLAATTAE